LTHAQLPADAPLATGHVTDSDDHGTLGTAMTAAVMVGWFAEVFSASNDMVHVSRTVSPNPENHRVYQTKYQLYKNLLSEMQSPWKSCSNYIAH
ncbi:carbohydrate kinase, partial [Klebsiella pneumoniae]|nr:carbohydrate kinase [Klebsiella pneumoniae]